MDHVHVLSDRHNRLNQKKKISLQKCKISQKKKSENNPHTICPLVLHYLTYSLCISFLKKKKNWCIDYRLQTWGAIAKKIILRELIYIKKNCGEKYFIKTT